MVPNASGNPVNHGLTLPGSGTTVFPLPGSFPWSTGARGTGFRKPSQLNLKLLSYHNMALSWYRGAYFFAECKHQRTWKPIVREKTPGPLSIFPLWTAKPLGFCPLLLVKLRKVLSSYSWMICQIWTKCRRFTITSSLGQQEQCESNYG